MEYSNLASKILLSRQWDQQHLVTPDPPPAVNAMMRLLGRTLLRTDISDIEVKAPIFVIGTPRCGSTMLQQLMCAHDKIAFFTNAMAAYRDPKAFRAVDWIRTRFNLDVRGERYLKDSIVVDSTSPSEAMRFWIEAFHLENHTLTWPQRRAKDFDPAEITAIRDYIRYAIAYFRDRGSDRFLNKSPALFTEVLLLQDIFPDAKFVYLIRDGRMVANSLVKLFKLQREQDIKTNHPLFKDQPFVPYPRVPGLEEAARKWGLDDIRTTATIWDSSIKMINGIRSQIRNLHEVRYEDILTDPRGSLQKIFDFCELPPATTGLEAIEAQLAKIGVVGHKNSYSGFEVVEEIAHDGLKQYGYI